ncbi:MAG: ETEC_3214 domain-containing protein [Pseudonocardiaceae bacterium]
MNRALAAAVWLLGLLVLLVGCGSDDAAAAIRRGGSVPTISTTHTTSSGAVADGNQSLSFLDLLGAIGTSLVILAALIGSLRWLRVRYLATFGRRRVLRAKLGRLATEIRLEYVENLFGPSLLRDKVATLDRHVWWLHDVILQTTCDDDGTVKVFSVTVMHEKIKYRFHLPNGQSGDATLGKTPYSQFSDIEDANVIRAWAGARHWGYQEVYYFGNPGFYQTFSTGFNNIAPLGDPPISPLLTAMQEDDVNSDNVVLNLQNETALEALRKVREGSAPNTFAVAAPHWSFDDIDVLLRGPGVDKLRLLPTFNKFANKSPLRRLRRKHAPLSGGPEDGH